MEAYGNLAEHIRRIFLRSFFLATILVASPTSYGGTVLQDSAGKLQPGQWAELQTIGFNGGALLQQGSVYLTQYTDKAVWNPVTKELFFIGEGHGPGDSGGAFIKYGEACNCWTSLPLTGLGPPRHAYNHLSINPAAGKIYYRKFNDSIINQYDLAKNAWSILTPLSTALPNGRGQCCAALEYFPDVNGIVYVDGDWGLFLYDLGSGKWQQLAKTNQGGGYKMGSYENVMRYNPVTHQVVFGGGVSYGDPNDAKRLYALSPKLQITALPLAPYMVVLTDSVNSAIFVPDPVTGRFLLYATPDGVKGFAYELDAVAQTWTQLPSSVYPPFFQNSVGGPIFGTVATAIPEYGVVAFLDYEFPPRGKVLLYKHAAGLPAVPTPTPTPTPTPLPPLPPLGTTPGAADFQARCSAPGVIRCNGFDSATDIAGTYGDNKGTLPAQTAPAIDTSVKASGAGSLRFTIPANLPGNAAGSFFTNFSKDLSVQFGENTEFFIQWRQRFSPEFLTTLAGGFKQVIIGTGDKPGCTSSSSATGFCYASCTALELVTQNTYQRGFAQLYNSCTGSVSHRAYDPFEQRVGAYDFKLQNARPAPYCLYSQGQTTPKTYFPPPGNCFGYFPNEWMTFQIHVRTGLRVGDEFTNSHVDMWIARDGKPSEQVFSWGPYNLSAGPPAESQRFGKIWLLPYYQEANVHPAAYTWYDELIISRQRIPDPATPSPVTALNSAH